MAFIGHNGAGKTTTLKAICGIINFEEGEILVDGMSVKKDVQAVKKVMAYIPDTPDLYEHLKGIEFINFVADAYKVSSQKRQQLTEKYATLFNLHNNLGDYIKTYSHGMKQKLAIISALVHEPKLLLLDEPFVGLDPKSSHDFKEIMKELVKQNCAIFYSTHVLEVAEKLATHVAIINNGKLIAQGKLNELVGDKSLEKVFLELSENDKH